MSCETARRKNLALSACNELPAQPKGMIETPDDFAIPAATILAGNAAMLAYINAAAIGPYANRIFFWPFFDQGEDISKEATYEDTSLAYLPVDDGAYRFRFGISQNLCLHKAMYTHRRSNGRVIIIDKKNYYIGTELTNGDFAGLSIQMLHTEKMKFADGSVSTKSPIVVGLRDNLEFDKSGAMLAAPFLNEVLRITDVELALVGDNTATLITVSVKAKCDATAVSGLVAADFTLFDNDNGSAHAITSVTENANIPGQYAIVGVAFEASVLDLVSAENLSIEAYESLGALAIPAP